MSLFGNVTILTDHKGVLIVTDSRFNQSLIWWDCSLTWLPSLCQKMAGCGLPVASHWNVTVRPNPTTWFLGRTANTGGTGVCERVSVHHWYISGCVLTNTPLRASQHDDKTLQVMLLERNNQWWRRTTFNSTSWSALFLFYHSSLPVIFHKIY